jgi:hypothetical protein
MNPSDHSLPGGDCQFSHAPYVEGMNLHLIKLSVGPEKLSDLANWQEQRLAEHRRTGSTPELMHVTRNFPKRADELLNGGSIYWVIKGFIVARQKLVELRKLEREGVPHCGLVLGHELIRTVPRPHRPFQGWRYFDAAKAPADIKVGDTYDELDEELHQQLARAGLV